MVNLKKTFVLGLFPLLVGCLEDVKREPMEEYARYENAEKVGKYLYMDNRQCLHADRLCMNLRFKERGANYPVKFVRQTDVIIPEEMSYCSRCVNDADYEKICDKKVRR